jgi:hypothetical protein
MSSKDSFRFSETVSSTNRTMASGLTDKSDRFSSTSSTIVSNGVLFRNTSGLNAPGPGDYNPHGDGLLKKSFNVKSNRPRSSSKVYRKFNSTIV